MSGTLPRTSVAPPLTYGATHGFASSCSRVGGLRRTVPLLKIVPNDAGFRIEPSAERSWHDSSTSVTVPKH